MGKIIICSQLQDYESMNKFFSHEKITAREEDLSYVLTYSKKNITTDNYFKDEEGYIFGTGTIFYKGHIGKEALQSIYYDFDEDFLFRHSVVGSYCISINKGNKQYVFVDQSGTYNIYYYNKNGRFVLTNTYYHVAKVINAKDVDSNRIIEQVFQATLLEGNTIFDEVKRLQANECIVLDGDKIESRSISISQEQFSGDFWKNVLQYYSPIAEEMRDSCIFMTGGQDSRLNLALLLGLGIRPKLLYGIGNSLNTCTKQEDLECVEAISEAFDLPMERLDWSETDYLNGLYDDFNLYGEYAMLYRHNKNIIQLFNDIKTRFVHFGYFGEIYRNIEIIETARKTHYTLDEFLDCLYINGKVALFNKRYAEYRQNIKNEIKCICERKGVDVNYITLNDFQKIHSEYRKRADVLMSNYANQYCYSVPLLSDIKLLNTIEKYSVGEKKNSTLILHGINSFEPKLLNIEFFSHIKRKIIDFERMEMYDEQSLIMNMKDKLRKSVTNEFLLKFMRKIYYFIKKDKKGNEELNFDYIEKQDTLSQIKELIVDSDIDFNVMAEQYDTRVLKSIYLLECLHRFMFE